MSDRTGSGRSDGTTGRRTVGTWISSHRRGVAGAAAIACAIVGGTVIALAVNPGGGPPPAPLAGGSAPAVAASMADSSPLSDLVAPPHGPGSTAPAAPPATRATTRRLPSTEPPSLTGDTASPITTAADSEPGRGLVLPRSIPVSIRIPAINVTSRLLKLGLNADGTVQVPPLDAQPSQAGWYRYSPTPGQLGPAVILGHVDSAANGPAVFFRLGALRKGDTVLVTRADGSTAVFRVDRTVRYSKRHFPTDEVYGNIDHAGLRLITCGGTFDFSSKQYQDDVVVYASLVATRG